VALFDFIRPVCPHCAGKGGFVDGYYEPEFYGCRCCNEDESREEPVTRVWRWRWWLFRLDQWREGRHWEKMYNAEFGTPDRRDQ
jgi:hypothetical protein